MPRSNKTSNVLKLLKGSEIEKTSEIEKIAGNPETPDTDKRDNAPFPEEAEFYPPPFPQEQPEIPAPAKPPKKRRRKAIVKHLDIDKIYDAPAENPALKAIAYDPADEKIYVRAMGVHAERQIVSVPLMLINEQLGPAVERFNVCACDRCLRGISDSALDLMQPMYVRVVNSADEDEVNRLIRERRPEAIRALAKICITALTKPFHEYE